MKDQQKYFSQENQSPFIVGIDLGTTNCAVAYVKTDSGQEENIQVFNILQLVSEGNLSHLPLLPSYLYLPSPHELLQENIRLPWDSEINFVVGEFGKKLGAQVPARLVSSAKSWLCHAGVDRKAAILPWGAGKDLTKLSPLEASSRYLQHIKNSWDHQMAQGKQEYLLENQILILTVPASFDEAARELTVEAAQKIGLKKIILLEEPQAAFYCWIATNRGTWHHHLHNGQIVLICDMGGGTSDFSLISVQEEKGKPLFTRVAVGDHLILGGDNIDMALARHIEIKLMGQSGKLDLSQWAMLSHHCRMAKEELLSENHIQHNHNHERDSYPIVVQDRTSRLIGGTLKYELTKEEMISIIEDGFFPTTGREEAQAKTSRMGLQEWGLPYAQDTAISHHLSSFLQKHQAEMKEMRQKVLKAHGDITMPDAVLFNGGALKPPFLQKRITQAMENWFTTVGGSAPVVGERWKPIVLSNKMADLAVAYGAAYYGLVRQGKGVFIRGGIGRSYYIGLGSEKKEAVIGKEPSVQTLCVVPRKMEEGQEIEIKDKEFTLLIGEPVTFPLYDSSSRLLDQAGDILSVDEEIIQSLNSLPPLQTILRRGRAKHREVPVHLRARLTEIGTIEIWCVTHEGDRQWRLQFGIRQAGKSKPAPSTVIDQVAAAEDESLDVERVMPLFLAVFGGKLKETTQHTDFKKPTPENLFKLMEKVLKAGRQNWPIFTLRKITEMLLKVADKRLQSVEHEARWFNLVGFCMRPGFGYPLDEWRIQNMWKIFTPGPTFLKNRETRIQWWILWRRLAGGLNQKQQTEIYKKIAPYLIPQKKIPPGPKPSSHELSELWRLGASLEQLAESSKVKMGAVLLDWLSQGRFLPADLWALARLGARQPLYGSLHTVVSVDIVEEWIDKLLINEKLPEVTKIFTLTQLTRKTTDRARNVGEEIRQRVIDFITQANEKCVSTQPGKTEVASLEQAIQSIREVSHYKSGDQALIFGESLPKGLQVK